MTVAYEGFVRHILRIKSLETGEILHDPSTCLLPECVQARSRQLSEYELLIGFRCPESDRIHVGRGKCCNPPPPPPKRSKEDWPKPVPFPTIDLSEIYMMNFDVLDVAFKRTAETKE